MTEASHTGKVLVIIPTFNEAQNIESIVSRLRRSVPEAHVLVVDDNSPDGTGKLVDAMAEQDDYVHVLHRRGKEGLGAAYLAGFHWGLERGYGVLLSSPEVLTPIMNSCPACWPPWNTPTWSRAPAGSRAVPW